jgi:hypothetical protein
VLEVLMSMNLPSNSLRKQVEQESVRRKKVAIAAKLTEFSTLQPWRSSG